VSPDLTRHDPATLGPSGGPITLDQTTAEYYGTIFAIAESPRVKGLIWTGSDDGLINLTRDGGKHWTNVTPKGFGDFTRVSIIEASHYAPGTAYVAANRYQLEDMAPYIWKTTDYGRTWSKIVKGLPATEFVRVVREDPVRRGLLFAGTERGVWVSFNDGASWESLRRNLPIVPVHDLAVKEGDLVAATHGRSFWILDDIAPLRQLVRATPREAVHLFKPSDAYRVDWSGGFQFPASEAHAVREHLEGRAQPPAPPPAGRPAGAQQAGRQHVRLEHEVCAGPELLGDQRRRHRRSDGAPRPLSGAAHGRWENCHAELRAQARSPVQGHAGRSASAVRVLEAAARYRERGDHRDHHDPQRARAAHGRRRGSGGRGESVHPEAQRHRRRVISGAQPGGRRRAGVSPGPDRASQLADLRGQHHGRAAHGADV